MGAAPPLMTLRDLLELACESSCSEGFRTYPRRLPWRDGDALQLQAKAVETAPVRAIIEAGLRRSPSQTLSSILFQRSPRSSLAAISRLSRSLSRRLAFWRRHRGDSDDDGGSDAGERDSLGLPSPVVSSCSASQCSEPVGEAADLPVPEEPNSRPSECEKPSTSTSSGNAGSADDADDGAAAGDGHKALDGDPTVGSGLESMEDKQRLSPVSVMDFPFHEDDDGDERSDAGTCSPSFLQCQPDLERSKSSSAHELPHKIRRLDGLAQAAVDPVDLEPLFVASDDSGTASVSDDTQQTQSDSSSTSTDQESASATTTSTPRSPDEQHRGADDAEREHDEHDQRRLLARLLKDDYVAEGASAVAMERLLLDFFAEGLDRGRCSKAGPVVGTVKPSDQDHDEAALVRAAREWMQGLGTQWGVEDVLFAGPAALADMDRERRWTCVGEEEQEVGVAVEGLLMDALVAELVRDMAARC